MQNTYLLFWCSKPFSYLLLKVNKSELDIKVFLRLLTYYSKKFDCIENVSFFSRTIKQNIDLLFAIIYFWFTYRSIDKLKSESFFFHFLKLTFRICPILCRILLCVDVCLQLRLAFKSKNLLFDFQQPAREKCNILNKMSR